MWVGNLLVATRLRRLPFSASAGNDDHARLTQRGPLAPPQDEGCFLRRDVRCLRLLDRDVWRCRGWRRRWAASRPASSQWPAALPRWPPVARRVRSPDLAAQRRSFLRGSSRSCGAVSRLDGEGSIAAPASVRDSSHGRPNRGRGQTSNLSSGSNPDFIIAGYTSASAECRPGPGRQSVGQAGQVCFV